MYIPSPEATLWLQAKKSGFSDEQIGRCIGATESAVRASRKVSRCLPIDQFASLLSLCIALLWLSHLSSKVERLV